jgi:hypothetical protein
MSRSRSPSPYKGNYRRRISRSISPTVLTKEEQLKKIADLTIINVGRRRDYNDIFGDEKSFWTSIQAEKRGDTNFDAENIWKRKFQKNGTIHCSNAPSPRTSTTSRQQIYHQCHITT